MRTDRLHRPLQDLLAGLTLPLDTDVRLLEQAVTHPSYAAEHPDRHHYERLEFLGDAVLKQLVAEWLYETYPEDAEGLLSKVLHRMVSNAVLAEVAAGLDLASYMRFGRGEERTGGRERPSSAASAFEAVVGALQLTLGPGAVRVLVRRLLADRLEIIHGAPDADNPKVVLAEWCQRRHGCLPEYQTLQEVMVSASQHMFEVEVRLHGRVLGRGEGGSRRAAEQAAARRALEGLDRSQAQRRPPRRTRTGRLQTP